ncbi:hypothetical protein BDQ17DRAFT_674837 [Cyathus striatus]|nr:hypothetical protein BDQ17DRAFT_674837 [Cyathus striatus]
MLVWTVMSILVLLNSKGFPGGAVFSGCRYVIPDYYFVGWIPGILFESILMIFTIKKSFFSSFQNSTVRIIARDSIVYFVLMLVALTFNLVYSLVGNIYIAPLLILPSSVIACIAASRISMNLRQLTACLILQLRNMNNIKPMN